MQTRMSPRAGSLKTGLAVALVFGVGLGLGAGWKLGWIPLRIDSVTGGSLAESAAPESADHVNNDEIPSDEAEPLSLTALSVPQGEPPVEEGVNQKPVTEPPRVLRDPELDDVPVIRLKPDPRKAKSSSAGRTAPARPDPLAVRPARYQTENISDPEAGTPKRVEESSEESSGEQTADRFSAIDEKLASGEILAAQKALSRLYWNAREFDPELQQRLDETARKIFFSPQPHFIEAYVVQPGDQLRKIAGKYQLSWEYLAALNRTDPRRLREGQKLKVLKGPFAAIVNLKSYSLTLHLQGYYVKRYEVGIGKDGSSPVGKFPVLTKIENPQYTDPDGKVIEGNDPANPLGKRWIDLGDSYGIHGTIDPDSIGKAESRGCIRLRDADIIEVYNFLVPGSVVEIRE